MANKRQCKPGASRNERRSDQGDWRLHLHMAALPTLLAAHLSVLSTVIFSDQTGCLASSRCGQRGPTLFCDQLYLDHVAASRELGSANTWPIPSAVGPAGCSR